MAELTSLKTPDTDDVCMYHPPAFGYGTEICLTPDQTGALGLTDMAAGQRVNIMAVGIVTHADTMVDTDGDSPTGKELSIRIQLTDMGIKKSGAADPKRAAAVLYGGDDQ